MRIQALLPIILIALSFCGCEVVTVRQPIGTPIQEDLSSELDGIWFDGEGGVLYLKCQENGMMQLAGVVWQNEAFNLSQGTAVLTTLGEESYINLVVVDSSKTDTTYFFARYVLTDDGNWIISVDRTPVFKQAVENGALKGSIREAEGTLLVAIEGEKEIFEGFLSSKPVYELFDFDNSVVLRRISEELPEEMFY